MQTTDKAGNTAAIADLQNKWNRLGDVDRARAVHNIHHARTISLRSLAKALNCSESLLRQLNKAAQAPVWDRIKARKKEISTRELGRRAKKAKALQADKASKENSERVCNAICDFLVQEDWLPQFGEKLIDEARRHLAFAEARQLIPQKPFPPLGLPLMEALKRLWPPPHSDDATDFNIRAECLVNFVVAALPDSMSRHRALELALQREIERPSPSRQVGTPK